MLTIIVKGDEVFDEVTNTFDTIGDVTLEFEHSLVSLSKWESKFQRPFLADKDKTSDEVFWYIRAMLLTEDISPDVLNRLSISNLNEINDYLESKESATTFGTMPEHKTRGKAETITAELIYYWMVAFTIPIECQYWHINRLFALIRICNIKNAKPKKMSRTEIAQRNRDLNAERKKQLGTSG